MMRFNKELKELHEMDHPIKKKEEAGDPEGIPFDDEEDDDDDTFFKD